ncbi:MAG: hypothetical protein IE934_18705, partial [Sphingopyxis sp.]|nr:hypothetical protein [Sphingopyxis sp.]
MTNSEARAMMAGLAKAPGDHPEAGGFQAARELADPRGQMAALDQIIRDTARTSPVAGSLAAGHIAYVTRSA